MKRVLLAHDLQGGPWERKQFMERSGFQVDLCADVESCLALVEQTRPDIVLLDVLLEGANGFDLCRQLRTRYSADELPILICGGIYRGAKFEGEARAAGAQDLLPTPMEPHRLIEEIVRHTRPARPVAGHEPHPEPGRAPQIATPRAAD